MLVRVEVIWSLAPAVLIYFYEDGLELSDLVARELVGNAQQRGLFQLVHAYTGHGTGLRQYPSRTSRLIALA